MDTNIEHFEFDYACESSKIEFQSTIGSLLELQALLASRSAGAIDRGKPGVYFSNAELDVYTDWIMNSAIALMEHYRAIDKTNRFLNKRIELVVIASKRKAA